MNRTLVLATALAAGLAVPSLTAQAATSSATPASAAPNVKPEAIPAKVAIIAFEQAVVATNEGQRAMADVQKKYEPKKNAIDAQAAEVDSLKKQVQGLPATTSDDERARRLRTIDEKEKALNRDAEDAHQRLPGRSAGGLRQGCAEGRRRCREVRAGQRLHSDAQRRWQSADAEPGSLVCSAHGHHAGCRKRLQHELGRYRSSAFGSGRAPHHAARRWCSCSPRYDGHPLISTQA